jgi:hypothetical protein
MLVEWVGGMDDEARMTNDECRKVLYSSFVIRHSSFSSAVTLSLLAAREACREEGSLVVIDRQRTFYPPAAAAWGIDLGRLIVVRPASARDQLWAAVESLRSPAVAAVWTAIERIDDRAFRRLQLAAHAGGTLGLLVRPAGAVREPSWADVRLGVGTAELQNANCKMQIANWKRRKRQAMNDLQFAICNLQSSPPPWAVRRVQVYVLRCRHGRAGGEAWLEIDDVARVVREARVDHDAHPLPMVAELADSASDRGVG